MNITQAKYEFLQTSTDVVSLVGGRIYPNKKKQFDELPCISYFRIDADRHNTTKGPSTLVTARFQLDFWSTDYDVKEELANYTKKHMNGYRGFWGPLDIQSCFLVFESDQPEPDEDMFHGIHHYEITYKEDY